MVFVCVYHIREKKKMYSRKHRICCVHIPISGRHIFASRTAHHTLPTVPKFNYFLVNSRLKQNTSETNERNRKKLPLVFKFDNFSLTVVFVFIFCCGSFSTRGKKNYTIFHLIFICMCVYVFEMRELCVLVGTRACCTCVHIHIRNLMLCEILMCMSGVE